ncbi:MULTISPECIES: pentapeptide repeat-containing protein [unclassified Rhizobium]|uniref:pentapeptide repeat-containing protein n=1 Tax=unclassified Rhizobium TaxID=2613769 RepID=UPI00380A91CF
MMKIEIKSRWDDTVLYAAEVEADENTPNSILLRLAILAAIEAKADLSSADLSYADLSYANLRSADLRYADLRSADLRYADLRYANLRSADLRYANLRSADLSSADLSYADLRSFKADLWMTLTQNRHEVPALVAALRDGRVDGSTYEGECACLVGTIANAKNVYYEVLDHGASNPAEQWFAMIRKGDKPEDDSAGGFASKMALEWATEWCVLNEIAIEPIEPVAAE